MPTYNKGTQKIEAKVTFTNKGKTLPVSEKLANFIVEVFTDGTAAAYTAKRYEMVKALIANLAALKVESFNIESNVEIITINANAFAELLPNMVKAMDANKAYRASVEKTNESYDTARTVKSLIEKDSIVKRGRKSADYASETLSLT